MGIIRLTLIAAVLIWGAMYYFGRDEGLPENRLGRSPSPADPATAPAAMVAPEPAAPEEPATPEATGPAADEAPAPLETVAETAPEPVEPAPAIETEPEPVPQPEPEPGPGPEPAIEPQAEPEVTLYVSGRVVNVRSGPSTSFDAITSLQRGAPVIDLGDVGDGWRRIRLPSGDFGYMSADFLSSDPQ